MHCQQGWGALQTTCAWLREAAKLRAFCGSFSSLAAHLICNICLMHNEEPHCALCTWNAFWDLCGEETGPNWVLLAWKARALVCWVEAELFQKHFFPVFCLSHFRLGGWFSRAFATLWTHKWAHSRWPPPNIAVVTLAHLVSGHGSETLQCVPALAPSLCCAPAPPECHSSVPLGVGGGGGEHATYPITMRALKAIHGVQNHGK